MKSAFYTGTSGIVLPYKNKSFYPASLHDKSRLGVYGVLCNSLEVNSSFYKIPQARTVARWCTEVAGDFRFTFKLWKGITHHKNLDFNPADVHLFMQIVREAAEKRGCLLIQFPPSMSFSSFHQLEKLLNTLRQSDPEYVWPLCVEFRHSSWHRCETIQLLRNHGAFMVLHDKGATGIRLEQAWGDIVYLRLHGPDGDYRGSYDEATLAEYASYVNDWLSNGKEVYVYFNNTIGDALNNLSVLKSYILS